MDEETNIFEVIEAIRKLIENPEYRKIEKELMEIRKEVEHIEDPAERIYVLNEKVRDWVKNRVKRFGLDESKEGDSDAR